MDQTTLVDEQIADGKRFLNHLAEAGFPVLAAAWVRETERWRWHLYLVSPVAEGQGIRTAYRRLRTVMREMPQPFSLGPFDIMAVEPHDPMGEALLDLQRRHLGRSWFPFGGSQFGAVEVEAVYLYPPVADAEQTNRPVSGVK
jgi:hypothetical protein